MSFGGPGCASVLVVFLLAASAAAPLKCGVATGTFALNTPTLTTSVQTGKMSFWWNWNTAPVLDTSGMSNATIAAMNKAFVPMLWGTASPSDYDFLKDKEGDVMGFNEPDLYGPECCNCKGKQQYYPATSSGWLPLFNPKSAAVHWRSTVNNLTTTQRPGTTERRIVSPAMANGATPAPGIDCSLDPAIAPNPKRCEGWLSMFKAAALKLDCTRFNGSRTNCWDVIDALQIHSYTKKAADVLTRIEGYLDHFSDDFDGAGGRSKKTLWLTEVAAGSNEASEIVPFVKALMSTQGGLADRTKYAAVSHVSWFSEFFFPAFDVSGSAARPYESWSSALFDPYGGLNDVGDAFFENCAAVAETQTA